MGWKCRIRFYQILKFRLLKNLIFGRMRNRDIKSPNFWLVKNLGWKIRNRNLKTWNSISIFNFLAENLISRIPKSVFLIPLESHFETQKIEFSDIENPQILIFVSNSNNNFSNQNLHFVWGRRKSSFTKKLSYKISMPKCPKSRAKSAFSYNFRPKKQQLNFKICAHFVRGDWAGSWFQRRWCSSGHNALDGQSWRRFFFNLFFKFK